MQPPQTKVVAARAAVLVHSIILFREELMKQTLKPILLQDVVPLCSKQHERQFNTTRTPGIVSDKIEHFEDSTHVAVYSNGKWYALQVIHEDQILNPRELER